MSTTFSHCKCLKMLTGQTITSNPSPITSGNPIGRKFCDSLLFAVRWIPPDQQRAVIQFPSQKEHASNLYERGVWRKQCSQRAPSSGSQRKAMLRRVKRKDLPRPGRQTNSAMISACG
ncbi:hypothetical protein AVEN_79422-1 [Araneus ventricosus]|uniref:Uncharacterized protein n=1 Tax=Araneus ventricosus TaxID=182803 RepID=A0A4Y2V556_ARAVE|nr:hypothetical protein AVEN_79422-1 [Araneus ventricosus]